VSRQPSAISRQRQAAVEWLVPRCSVQPIGDLLSPLTVDLRRFIARFWNRISRSLKLMADG
jgi:hypothetical protein